MKTQRSYKRKSNVYNAYYKLIWSWFKANEKQLYTDLITKNRNSKDYPDRRFTDIFENFRISINAHSEKQGDKFEWFFFGNMSTVAYAFLEGFIVRAPESAYFTFRALDPHPNGFSMHYKFDEVLIDMDTLFFYEKESPEYPDLVELVFVHKLIGKTANKKSMKSITYHEGGRHQAVNQDDYLDTVQMVLTQYLCAYIGERDLLLKIDKLKFQDPRYVKQTLLPLTKIEAFLNYRYKDYLTKDTKEVFIPSDDKDWYVFRGELLEGNLTEDFVDIKVFTYENRFAYPWIGSFNMYYNHVDHSETDKKLALYQTNLVKTYFKNLLTIDTNCIFLDERVINDVSGDYSETKVFSFACKDVALAAYMFQNVKDVVGNPLAIDYDFVKDKYWETIDIFRTTYYESL
ncbi:hypothetical protein [Sphingobacterium hungaricum]